MNLTQIETETKTQLALAKQARASLPAVTITDDAGYEEAGRVVVEMKSKIKVLEEQRKTWVDPLNQTVKNINAFFKPVVTEWENVVEGLKSAMVAYQQRVAQEKQAALAAAGQLAAQGSAVGTGPSVQQYQALVAMGAAPAPKADGIFMREKWSWRVVDGSLVPREYLGVDVAKVNEAVRQGKGATQIPGIEVFREDVVVARG